MCECEIFYVPQNRKTLFLRVLEKIITKLYENELDIKEFRKTDAYEVIELLDAYSSDLNKSTNVLIKEIYLKKVDEK